MKKLIIAFMTLAMMASMAACGGNVNTDVDETNNESSVIETTDTIDEVDEETDAVEEETDAETPEEADLEEKLVGTVWYQNVQYPCAVRFEADGKLTNFDVDAATKELQDREIGGFDSYKVDGDKLVLYFNDGSLVLDYVRRSDLDADDKMIVSNTPELKDIPDDEYFLYETDFDYEADPMGCETWFIPFAE